jgi:hypothetical protein
LVLDRDYLSVPKIRIHAIQPVMTMVAVRSSTGRIDPGHPAKVIARRPCAENGAMTGLVDAAIRAPAMRTR